MKQIVLVLIQIYQKLKPIRSGVARLFFIQESSCKFRPTCSDYIYQAVAKYGAIKGLYIGLKRIMRCSPLSKGGIDPIK